jgi:hypothetical protein
LWCSSLGNFVTSDEKEQTLIDALELLKSCLPDFAFYGAHAPKVFMTDNCYELRASLNEVWPSAVSVLCIFHLLQQVWRWLHGKKNGISMEDRPQLLLSFKRIVYAESEEAQFLVIKDEILNRQKEVNIVGLLDKFPTELDQHSNVDIIR